MFRNQPERLRLRRLIQKYFTKDEEGKASNDPFHVNETIQYYDPDWEQWYALDEHIERHYVELPSEDKKSI